MQEFLDKTTAGALKLTYLVLWDQYVGHQPSMSRLQRAYEILTQSDSYVLTMPHVPLGEPVTLCLSGPNDTYVILPSQQRCSCPDKETLCKHRILVKLLFNAIR